VLKLDRKPRALRVALGLAAVIAVIAGGVTYMRRPPPPPSTPLGPVPKVSVLEAGKDAPTAATPATAPPKASLPTVVESPRLYAQEDEFRQLMASSNPRDNARGYLAYAWDCANEAENLRMNERVPGAAPVAPKCGLAPGTWQDAELRKKGVVAAARLGLPNGWAHLYLEEGPGGRLGAFSEAEKAEWQQLVAETYPIAIKAMDSAALAHEAVVQEAAGNYARAVELHVASMAALARRTNQPYQSPDVAIAPLRAKMSAADFNHAVAEGRRTAETAKQGELL